MPTFFFFRNAVCVSIILHFQDFTLISFTVDLEDVNLDKRFRGFAV